MTDGKRAPENVDRYLDGRYLARNPDWHVGESGWKAQRILEILRANGLAPKRVAEVGCGAGAVLAALHGSLPDAECDGFDPAPQAIELARLREAPGLRYHVGAPATTAPAYDLLMVIDVMEHIEDVFGFLRGLRDRAEAFVFHIPLDLSAQAVLRARPLMRRREEVGHLHYFTRDTALATLRETGYETIDWRYTAGTLDLPVATPVARAATLPRRLLYAASPDFAARLLGGFSLVALTR